MMKKSLMGAALALAVAQPAFADDKSLELSNFQTSPGMVVTDYSPVRQYFYMLGDESGMSPRGALFQADQLGDKMSQLARYALLNQCFGNDGEGPEADTVGVALCGPDFKAFDREKLKKELIAEHVSEDDINKRLQFADKAIAAIKPAIERVEAAAKEDPGVQAFLDLAQKERTAWVAYQKEHQADVDRYLRLEAAYRSHKTNHPAFKDCDATGGVLQQIVAQAQLPKPEDFEFKRQMIEATSLAIADVRGGFPALFSHLACQYNDLPDAAFGPLSQLIRSSGDTGGEISIYQLGPRSRALVAMTKDTFAPKFGDRSWNKQKFISSYWQGTPAAKALWGGEVPTGSTRSPGGGESGAIVAALKSSGDTTTVSFKKGTVAVCSKSKEIIGAWRLNSSGTWVHPEMCVATKMVPVDVGPITVKTASVINITPGSTVYAWGTPVQVIKNKKLVNVFGVAVK